MPLLLLLALVLVCAPYGAASQRFAYQHYRQGNGLPAEQVRTVAKGKSGALWVGTDDGLFRFAGQDFISYNNLLESYYVRAFAQNGDGDLLFCNDTGVHLLLEESDSARVQQLIPATFVPSDSTLFYPNALHYDQAGTLWISQPDGRLGRWQNGQLTFIQPGEPYQGPKGKARYRFSETTGGQLLLSDPQGQVFLYQQEDKNFEPLSAPVAGGADALLIHAGQIWSGGDQLRHFIRGRDHWSLNRSVPVPHGRITVLKPTANPDHLLVGTAEEGLFLYDATHDNWQTVFGSNDPHRIEELPLRHINEIVADRTGDWWVCTTEGLGLLQQPFFSTVFGQVNNSTLSLAAHPDGSVLVSYGEVYQMTPAGDGFSSRVLPELEEGLITAVAITTGETWLASSRGEIFRLRQEGLSLQTDLQERGGGIFFMQADAAQNFWICQAPDETPIVGVARYHPDEGLVTYGAAEGLDDRVLVVRQGPKQRIYAAGIGPETYLYRYEPTSDRFLNLSLPLPFSYSATFEVHDLAVDTQGIVWLATTDGLLQYDLERIRRVDLGDYTNDEIRSVVAGKENQLWIATATAGILYYDTDQRQFTRLNESSGLPSIIAAYRSMLQDVVGRIWVGTAEGVVYSKAGSPIPELSPQPHWRHCWLNGRWQSFTENILINPNDQLQLSWSTTAFSSGPVNYRYRIRGKADSTWVAWQEKTELELPVLNPGNYVLEVQALQAGGYQWSLPLAVRLEVQKPWYERWWGLGLLLLSGVLLTTAIFRSTIGALRLRLRVLNRQNTSLRAAQKRYQKQEQTLKTQNARQAHQLAELERQLALFRQLSNKSLGGLAATELLEAVGGPLANMFQAAFVELAWQKETQIVRRAYWQAPVTYLMKIQPLADWSWVKLTRGEVARGQQDSGYPLLILEPDQQNAPYYLASSWCSVAGQPFYLLLYRKGKEFSLYDEQLLKMIGQYLEQEIDQPLKK